MFLEPVIDELVKMFEKGVEDVWDKDKKKHVTIKTVLIATYNHRPARLRFVVRREDKRLYWMCRVLGRHRCGKSAK